MHIALRSFEDGWDKNVLDNKFFVNSGHSFTPVWSAEILK